MSRLNISFPVQYRRIPSGVIPVRIFDKDSRPVKGVNQTLTFAIPLEIEVPSGELVVQASLPSGEFINQQVIVPPNETFSLKLEPQSISDIYPDESLLLYNRHLKSAARDETKSFVSKNSPLSITGTPALGFWTNHSNGKWVKVNYTKPLIYPPNYGVYRTSLEPIWLRIQWSLKDAKFVAFPPSSLVRFFLEESLLDTKDPISVEIETDNADVESILAFMQQGDFDCARLAGGSGIGKSGKAFFSSNVTDIDINAFIVGGYFSLLAGELNDLLTWTESYAEELSFFSDVLVIYGWSCLKQNEPDFASAQMYFIEAAYMGLPVYTYGLRLLHDGLVLLSSWNQQFDNPQNEELENAIAKIASYSAEADWSSMTTCFYALEPDVLNK